MRLLNWLVHKTRWKVVHGTRFPKANLLSCLLNLAQRGFEPAEIIDVGAHRGRWSAVARRVFPKAGFTLIEPQEELQGYLRQFCSRRTNCRYLIAGAGSQEGELPFTVCPNSSASNFASTAEEARRRGGFQRLVPVTTLDRVVADHLRRIPDIVKVDAEGFEREVVLGAQSLIGKTELFFLEAHFLTASDDPSHFAALVEFMEERGYVVYDFTWFGRRQLDGALQLCEVVFALRDGYLRTRNPAKHSSANVQELRKAA